MGRFSNFDRCTTSARPSCPLPVPISPPHPVPSAQLGRPLKRVFAVDVLVCDTCGGRRGTSARRRAHPVREEQRDQDDRNDPRTGKPKHIPLDHDSLASGDPPDMNIYVLPGDTIWVP